MIKGIGTDIIELKKIRHHSQNLPFLNKVFTKNEVSYAKKKKDPVPHLATTFAAKEAIFKAMGTGWLNGQNIEIVRNKSGKPKALINGKLKKILKNSQILLSLSYNSHSAVAFAVIKKK